MSIEFNPGFPLEELKENVNNGYFDEEVYNYLAATLKEDSNDSKELITGEISPCDFFELSIMERKKGWRSHYITSKEHETVDKEVITLLKNRIDMLFEKVKFDLGINKETDLEVAVKEQFEDKCKQCKELNKALDIMRTLQWTATDNYLSGLAYDRENETILIDEESLMRAIQLANPIQKYRKLRLITREEYKKLKTKL